MSREPFITKADIPEFKEFVEAYDRWLKASGKEPSDWYRKKLRAGLEQMGVIAPRREETS